MQKRILASCSGILLPGSPADIDPGRYGQQAIKECAEKDDARETTDDLLLRDAFELGKPILGICYGLQSLNVWRQGHADTGFAPCLLGEGAHGSSAASALVNHQPGREVQNAHPVMVTPGSRLSEVWAGAPERQDSGEVFVNSSHHQAIDRPGEQLRVAATSPVDGVIEALEGAAPEQFVLAVQWHPERSYENSAASRALFAAFLEAARAWLPASGCRKIMHSLNRTAQEIEAAFAEAGIAGLTPGAYERSLTILNS